MTKVTNPTPVAVGELPKSATLLRKLVADDIERNGPMESTMVRSGLLLDILDYALAHAALERPHSKEQG